MKTSFSVLFTIVSLCFTASVRADEYTGRTDLFVPLGSYHENEGTRKGSNQKNLGMGLTHNANKNLYGSFVYVKNNSKRGETYVLGTGARGHFSNVLDHRLFAGIEIQRLKYEDPNPKKPKTILGTLPALTFSAEQEDHGLHLKLYPTKGNSVLFFGVSFNNVSR